MNKNKIFRDKERKISENIIAKIDIGVSDSTGYGWQMMEQEELGAYFNNQENEIINRIFKINPLDFGSKMDFLGIDPVPFGLIPVKNQFYRIDGKTKIIRTQFLSQKILERIGKMNQVMEADIGCWLNVLSGYRSPAYQALAFFRHLHDNKWDVGKTLKRVALPGYSEHSCIEKQGIDFAPVKGIRPLDDFYKTIEYKWLCKNAKRFGFRLSYPEGNGSGIDFEPWHWRFSP